MIKKNFALILVLSRRIAKFAFDYATRHGRKKVSYKIQKKYIQYNI